MAETQCRRCGQNIRWVTLPSGERIALDALPRWEGTYALDPDDAEKAMKIETRGRSGYAAHDETCPSLASREARV